MAGCEVTSCPLCGYRSKRRSSRRIRSGNPNERRYMQYRRCLNPECLHRFKAFVTWTIDDQGEASVAI